MNKIRVITAHLALTDFRSYLLPWHGDTSQETGSSSPEVEIVDLLVMLRSGHRDYEAAMKYGHRVGDRL